MELFVTRPQYIEVFQQSQKAPFFLLVFVKFIDLTLDGSVMYHVLYIDLGLPRITEWFREFLVFALQRGKCLNTEILDFKYCCEKDAVIDDNRPSHWLTT